MTKIRSGKNLSYLILFLFLLSLIIWPTGLLRAAPQDLIINEIMYDLSGSDTDREWIELYNTGSDPVTIVTGSGTDSWRLSDAPLDRHIFKPFQGSLMIEPGQYLILAQNGSRFKQDYPDFRETTTIIEVSAVSLNNTEATLKLSADKGVTWFSEITYQKEWGGNGNGRTLERQPDDSFKQSSLDGGTPGAENSQPQEADRPPSSQPGPKGGEVVALLTIKEARQKEKDAEVLVEGIITATPGTFSAHYFYIQDQTAGIQIYFSKNLPSLSIGQKIRVLGTLSEAYNEKRIKISQGSDISSVGQNKEPEPISLKTGQVNEDHEGILVKVSGKVVEPSGSTFYLDDGTGKIKIYIKKETKIEKPRLKEGQELEITGIVSQYKDAYRILPRNNNDLKTTQGQVLTAAKKKTKGKAGEESIEEEESEGEASEGAGKVLGAMAKKSKQNWWLILLGLAILGGGGYLGYDFYKQKRTGNSKIWSKIRPAFERWRNYWALRRPWRW